MNYLILSSDEYVQVNLPEITGTALVRGNISVLSEGDIIVETIGALGVFLTEAAKHGQAIADIAKDGIKGIKEWAEILKMVPQIVPTLVRFYTGVIKNAEEFYKQVQNITPEQKTKAINIFVSNFDLTNDKAEIAVEGAVKLLLEVITLLKNIKL